MKFAVSVLHRAQSNADRIFQWIADRPPQGAAQWGRAYDDSLLELRRDADQYGLAPESQEVHVELRQKVFKTRRGRPYRLLYTIVSNEVRVLRVRGPGQLPVIADDILE
jgi:plasmid stabilization system protein ParE